MAETKKQSNPVKLYNKLNNKLEELKTAEPKKAKIYSCGPTVYNYAHIGNLRTYVNTDLLRRFLEYSGYKVEQVMNITDIEDKIIRDATKAGLNPENKKDLKGFTDKYEEAFYTDLKALNIEKAEHKPHATDEKVIAEMIKIIEGLLEKGFAYKTEDGVYFDITKFEKYGQLSDVNLAGIKEGARVDVDEYEKDDARDFALWKSAKEGEPNWEASFGAGRPGWHIECSAMSLLYLGETFDIHTGGVDLIFPHHENEIAQSQAYTGKLPAKYWFYGEHLLIDGERMGKRFNNFYTLGQLQEKFGAEPLAYRLLCLTAHYREKLNFTERSIKYAQNTLNNIRTFVARLDQWPKKPESHGKFNNIISKVKSDFQAALADDLNTPKAMAVMFDFMKKANIEASNGINAEEAKAIYETMMDFDKVLGLGLDKVKVQKVPDSVIKIAERREIYRTSSNYEDADRLRDEIEKQGYLVEDTEHGPVIWKK